MNLRLRLCVANAVPNERFSVREEGVVALYMRCFSFLTAYFGVLPTRVGMLRKLTSETL